jgi:hypothetical protein
MEWKPIARPGSSPSSVGLALPLAALFYFFTEPSTA